MAESSTGPCPTSAPAPCVEGGCTASKISPRDKCVSEAGGCHFPTSLIVSLALSEWKAPQSVPLVCRPGSGWM